MGGAPGQLFLFCISTYNTDSINTLFIYLYVPTPPEIKMKSSLFPQFRLKLWDYMGDSGLRCLDCLGKFGLPIANLRCGTCGLLYRLRELLQSDRYPPQATLIAELELKNVYFRLLEQAERVTKEFAGQEEAPPIEREEKQAEEERSVLQTTPKSAPPKKGEFSPTGGEASGSRPSPRKEEETKEREPTGEVKKEKPKKKHTDKPKAKDKKKDKRKSRSAGRSRTPKRRVKEEGESSGREAVAEAEEIEEDRKARDRSPLERRRARSPLRPRSPLGPPPPRAPDRRWSGPIPAGNWRQEDHRRGEREPQNKGAKKRRQQALFREFKAWREHYNRTQRRDHWR